MIFSSTKQEAFSHGIKAVVYGKAGAGKTTLARTAPKPVILSTEPGLLSLGDVDIPVVKANSLEKIYEFYNWITNPSNSKYFQTLFIDSLTESAEVILTNAKKSVKDQRQAYTKYAEDLIPFIKAFRDIPNLHVIMICKQEQNTDGNTGIILQGPMMPGNKVGQQIPYLFDEVFRLGVGKNENGEYRYLQTSLDIQHEAKDRSGCLDQFEIPDLTHVFNKIQSGKRRS